MNTAPGGIACSLAGLLFVAAGCGGSPGKGTAGPSRILSDKTDGTALLEPLAARARAGGAGSVAILTTEFASEGDRVGGFVALSGTECTLALARSSGQVTDIDLYAYDDDGSIYASDESPEVDGVLLLCPPQPKRVYVAARVAGGAGLVTVGLASVPTSSASAVAKAIPTRGRTTPEPTNLDGWPGLEAKVRAHRAGLGGRWEDVRRVALPVEPHASTRASFSLEPHRCFDVFVTPNDEVGALEIAAEDERGRIVARGAELGRDRAFVACSELLRELTITVRPHSSQGLVALVVGRSPVGGESEIASSALLAHATQSLDLAGARRELSTRLGADRPSRVVASGEAHPGVRVSSTIELPAGCSRLDVVAGKPLAGVEVDLWSERVEHLAEGRGGAVATMFTCGKGSRARVDVEALESAGPYAVELRSEAVAPPTLVAHPVAAARLLGRLEARGAVGGGPPAAAGAVAVTVSPDGLATLPLAVAPNGCMEVVAALDPGGSGLSMRLVDSGTHEGAVTRARATVSDVLCAGSTPKTATIEIRLDAGKADALVLARRVEGK